MVSCQKELFFRILTGPQFKRPGYESCVSGGAGGPLGAGGAGGFLDLALTGGAGGNWVWKRVRLNKQNLQYINIMEGRKKKVMIP